MARLVGYFLPALLLTAALVVVTYVRPRTLEISLTGWARSQSLRKTASIAADDQRRVFIAWFREVRRKPKLSGASQAGSIR
jgi:hypothetical protein